MRVDADLRYAQAGLLLGLLLIAGDYLADHIAFGPGPANLQRLTLALPVLLAGLAFSFTSVARRHWQAVMAGFIVTVALCLFTILVRIDAEGGAGLRSWVGVLNFTFLQFYCFVILGVQFRHALVAGLAIVAAFELALWRHASMSGEEAAYWSYHVVTVFLLAAGIGWWREFVLRKEFVARVALDDSRIAAEQRALQLAHYDEVTGLPNRRRFTELAAPALDRAQAEDQACAVLHLEVDRLRGVNEAFGRGPVDAALATVAQRLRACIRGADVVVTSPPAGEAGDTGVLARFSDNAFMVLVADLPGQERASAIAQRLLAAVRQPVAVAGQAVMLSASVGIAMYPGDGTDLTGLTRCAEQAARAARMAGGAQHLFFDRELNAGARDRVLLENELRQAIPGGQLCLHYQAKVDARNGALMGAEALVRWQHPQRGLVPPGRFIPMAEECGLIGPLTDWVLEAACASLRRWADRGLRTVPLSVNLPASSLADPSLLEQLERLMQRHRLSPASLMLELTETMLMRDLPATSQVLARLRDHGFGLSLDDFGTGYSSLSHLQRLPMNELKIDRAFITDVARGGRDSALATAIVTLGRELGLQVVAEGVETHEQSQFLLARGCELQQGYLFSRPLPEEAFELLLRRGSTLSVPTAAAA